MQGKKGEPGEKADTVDKTKEAYQVRWTRFGLIHIPLSNQWFCIFEAVHPTILVHFLEFHELSLHAKFWVNTKFLSGVADVLIS